MARDLQKISQSVHGECVELCVCGGYDGGQSLLTMEKFNFASGTWEALPVQLTPRFGAAVGSFRGQLYVCGGHDGHAALRSVERFSPRARHGEGAWQSLPRSEQRRSRAMATFAARELYLIGGHDGQSTLSSAERFNPETSSWVALPSMLQQRRSSGAATIGLSSYICGGLQGEDPLRSVERFDPDTGTWREIAPTLHARYGSTAAAVGSCLYVCGSFGANANCAERLDLAVGVWEVLPMMISPRTAPMVTACAGQVYVCGGYNGHRALESVERFDPRTNTWESLEPMTGARALAAAALLCL